MKSFFTTAALVATLLSASANAQAPTWSDAQMKVWEVVEQSWVDDAAENGKWPADYIHEKYSSWSDSQGGPRAAKASIAWNRFNNENSETLMYEVSPHAISVAGDTAIVHYTASTVTEDHKGERETTISRITEVLVRTGGTWKFLGGTSYSPKMNQ